MIKDEDVKYPFLTQRQIASGEAEAFLKELLSLRGKWMFFDNAAHIWAIEYAIEELHQSIQIELDKSIVLDSAQNSPKNNCFMQEPEIIEKVQKSGYEIDEFVSVGSRRYYESDERN